MLITPATLTPSKKPDAKSTGAGGLADKDAPQQGSTAMAPTAPAFSPSPQAPSAKSTAEAKQTEKRPGYDPTLAGVIKASKKDSQSADQHSTSLEKAPPKPSEQAGQTALSSTNKAQASSRKDATLQSQPRSATPTGSSHSRTKEVTNLSQVPRNPPQNANTAQASWAAPSQQLRAQSQEQFRREFKHQNWKAREDNAPKADLLNAEDLERFVLAYEERVYQDSKERSIDYAANVESRRDCMAQFTVSQWVETVRTMIKPHLRGEDPSVEGATVYKQPRDGKQTDAQKSSETQQPDPHQQQKRTSNGVEETGGIMIIRAALRSGYKNQIDQLCHEHNSKVQKNPQLQGAILSDARLKRIGELVENQQFVECCRSPREYETRMDAQIACIERLSITEWTTELQDNLLPLLMREEKEAEEEQARINAWQTEEQEQEQEQEQHLNPDSDGQMEGLQAEPPPLGQAAQSNPQGNDDLQNGEPQRKPPSDEELGALREHVENAFHAQIQTMNSQLPAFQQLRNPELILEVASQWEIQIFTENVQDFENWDHLEVYKKAADGLWNWFQQTTQADYIKRTQEMLQKRCAEDEELRELVEKDKNYGGSEAKATGGDARISTPSAHPQTVPENVAQFELPALTPKGEAFPELSIAPDLRVHALSSLHRLFRANNERAKQAQKTFLNDEDLVEMVHAVENNIMKRIRDEVTKSNEYVSVDEQERQYQQRHASREGEYSQAHFFEEKVRFFLRTVKGQPARGSAQRGAGQEVSRGADVLMVD